MRGIIRRKQAIRSGLGLTTGNLAATANNYRLSSTQTSWDEAQLTVSCEQPVSQRLGTSYSRGLMQNPGVSAVNKMGGTNP